MYILICWFLTAWPGVTDWLLARAKKTPAYHLEGYMNRWWLFNPIDDATRRRKWDWLPISIRFHEILRADDDRHLHNHPWDAVALILRNWYDEVRENPEFESAIIEHPGNPQYIETVRYPGDVSILRHGDVHRIVATSSKPVLTMFIIFKYQGPWGFKVDGNMIPWRQYIANGKEWK